MADDGPWRETAFLLQILAEFRECLILRVGRPQRPGRNRARVAQYRRPSPQRHPVARVGWTAFCLGVEDNARPFVHRGRSALERLLLSNSEDLRLS